jgi:hypothetical protein
MTVQTHRPISGEGHMSISKEIIESVNKVDGSMKQDYEGFIAGWLTFFDEFAKFLGRPIDEVIAETLEDVSEKEMVEVIMKSGWEPNEGESREHFVSRLQTLPIFKALQLPTSAVRH